MPDCMMPFPEDWHDFLKDYSFDDSQEVYTNGSRLIPVFRVEQLIKHLLKAQNKDAEIIRKCRDGKVLKHVGDGVVVLNYDWWRKMNEKCGHIKIVPSVEDLLKAQEPVDAIPVEWMRDKMRGYASSLKSTETAALVMVLTMWEKEQEAR